MTKTTTAPLARIALAPAPAPGRLAASNPIFQIEQPGRVGALIAEGRAEAVALDLLSNLILVHLRREA